MRNIYLIGMMGSGKTVTGQALAAELSWKFVDLDEEIVKSARMSVNEIFESRGEPYFRKLEKEGLRSVSRAEKQVVATGGGAILDPENVSVMKESGCLVYLRTSLETLWSRVQHKVDRPLLKVQDPKEVLGRLFYQRKPLYESSHDAMVLTDGKSAGQVSGEIIKALGLSNEKT